MGNGSSSRPPSTVVVRPADTNQTSFPSAARNDLVQTSNHNNFIPNGGIIEGNINVEGISFNPPLQPTCPTEFELDDSIEIAAAPTGSYGYNSTQTTTTQAGRNLQSKQKSKKVFQSKQLARSSDEIVFEVYRCYADGKECMVLNDEGTRFYLDSWETEEWQPFPEDWLNYGYIEVQDRNTAATNPDAVSTSDILLDNNDKQNPDDDDRVGVLHHPLKGELMTYIMDEQCNVHCVFDPSSGAWLKLPLSWELHSPNITSMISTIQQTIPNWDNEYEILALLRQCSYNVDETIATYLALLENDHTGWRHSVKNNEHSSLSYEEFDSKCREVKTLQQKVTQLERKLHVKEEELSDKENEFIEQLNEKESLIQKLEVKLLSLQNELEETKRELQQTLSKHQTIAVQKARTPTPKRRKLSPETVVAVRTSLTYLSNSTKKLKEALLTEKNDIQKMLESAIVGINELKSRSKSTVSQIAELRRLYNHEALHRKLLYNKVQELNGNIRVFCRCRFDAEAKMAVIFPSDCEVKVKGPSGDKTFLFDKMFTPSTMQEQVFEDTLPLITSCVDGYNVCIMAYGQTGSGKTYTMMGPENNPGVNVRSVKELLRICKERQNVEYTLTVSMLEVYNECLHDLLSDDGRSQLNIVMKGKVVVVTELTEVQVNSEDSIKKIMAKGNANRSVGETKMNTNSSRSHLVLIIHIKGVDQVSSSISHGTLTLVDLAGSERISKTEATGQRLVEAAAINKSLSALGQVFTALRTNAMHVPYRNSKLTQLLQGALGGDGKACLFVNISPAESNLSETMSTLNFGASAKQVQLGKPVQHIRRLPKQP